MKNTVKGRSIFYFCIDLTTYIHVQSCDPYNAFAQGHRAKIFKLYMTHRVSHIESDKIKFISKK